jgi:hypothetical protein
MQKISSTHRFQPESNSEKGKSTMSEMCRGGDSTRRIIHKIVQGGETARDTEKDSGDGEEG